MELVEGRPALRVVLANPRGFCAGVDRAIETVERALAVYGAPVYVRHEIVHNKRVCDELREKGAIFVEEVDEIPTGAITIFSAHGVARKVEADAAARGLEVIDATCPLVSRVHKAGRRYLEAGYRLILIGHAGHPEVTGTLGQIGGNAHLVASVEDVAALPFTSDERVAYVAQTTLSVLDTRGIIDAIRSRWPHAEGQDTRDICYATQNRQQAVLEIAPDVDMMIVVGAQNSSNTNRLAEIARGAGIPAHLVPGAEDLDRSWFEGIRAIGVTAGASAPEVSVREVLDRIGQWCRLMIEAAEPSAREDVVFRLPRELDGTDPQLSATG